MYMSTTLLLTPEGGQRSVENSNAGCIFSCFFFDRSWLLVWIVDEERENQFPRLVITKFKVPLVSEITVLITN